MATLIAVSLQSMASAPADFQKILFLFLLKKILRMHKISSSFCHTLETLKGGYKCHFPSQSLLTSQLSAPDPNQPLPNFYPTSHFQCPSNPVFPVKRGQIPVPILSHQAPSINTEVAWWFVSARKKKWINGKKIIRK